MTKTNSQDNTNDLTNPKNQQEYLEELLKKNQTTLLSYLNEIKSDLDKNPNPAKYIIFLDALNKSYTQIMVPCLKEIYSLNVLSSQLSAARADKTYATLNELYQHALKKLESFGVPPEVISEKDFPRCLEKIVFPENN